MKFLLILFFITPFTLLGQSPPEGIHGHYGREEIFTEEGKEPTAPKEYNKNSCFVTVKYFRTMLNRIRTLSFTLQKKCAKEHLDQECKTTADYMKPVLETINRQIESVSNACLKS